MKEIKPFTFYVNGKNSRDDFGIVGTSYDFLLPEKRQRSQQIPFRHGSYDYGAHWYNDRILRIRCLWFAGVIQNKTRADIREISYWLSRKSKIELAIEPDKYYIGEIYDSNELTAHYQYIADGPITTDGEFELNFTCEPFAYRASDGQPIQTGTNIINYQGTVEAPCTIVLKNTTSTTIRSVQVVATRRKA